MSDRTQDLKNLRAVATRCKNYTDAEIAKSEEKMKWYMGEYSVSTSDDNTTAYQKIVPTGATRGKLKSIGGMTIKGLNIYNQASVNMANKSFNGSTQTFDDNSNYDIYGYYNIEDTQYELKLYNNYNSASTTRTFIFYNNNNQIVSFIEKMPSANSNLDETIDVPSGATKLLLQIRKTDQNIELKEVNILRDSAVTSVKSYGANLLNVSDVAETTTSGIAYKIENGAITLLSGTATSSIKIATTSINVVSGMSLSAFNDKNLSGLTVQLRNNDVWVEDIYLNAINKTGTFANAGNSLNIGIANGTTISSPITIKPMLVKGATPATSYKTYRGVIDTFTIPSEILNKTGYGKGANSSSYNEWDLENNEFNQNNNEVDLGTLNFTDGSATAHTWWKGLPNCKSETRLANALCDRYELITSGALVDMSYFINNGWINIKNDSCDTTSQLNTALNGVKLLYERATPDVSSTTPVDNIIEVEEGGYLLFENQYGQAVPSEVTYRIEVAR